MEILIIMAYLLGLALALLLNFYVAKQFEIVANDKGYFERRYFHLCFWLGMVGYLLVIALPDRGNHESENTIKLPPL